MHMYFWVTFVQPDLWLYCILFLSPKYLTSETLVCMKYTVERGNKLFDSRVLRVIIDINKT